MSEPHVHGPECTSARVIGPFDSPPALVVILTLDDLANGTAHVESEIPSTLVPGVLRVLADRFERQNKASLS